mmetsp:Transcript_22192/g.41718  ORF Transcript_22192/g.41718 Transcript_22192/m.41718 type:complete len:198 (-) Transcript_22192:14-607(-)
MVLIGSQELDIQLHTYGEKNNALIKEIKSELFELNKLDEMLNTKKGKKGKKRDNSPKGNISKRISIRANMGLEGGGGAPQVDLDGGDALVEDEAHLPTFLENVKLEEKEKEKFIIRAVMPTVKTVLEDDAIEQAMMSLTDILHLVKHSKEEDAHLRQMNAANTAANKAKLLKLQKTEMLAKAEKDVNDVQKKKKNFF